MRKQNIIKFTLGCLSFVLLTSLTTSLTAQSAIDKLIGPSSLQKKGDPHWILTNTQKGYASKGTPISKTSFETKKQYSLFNGYYKSAIYFYEIGHRVQSIPYLMQAYDMLPNNLQLNALLGKTLCISTSCMKRLLLPSPI